MRGTCAELASLLAEWGQSYQELRASVQDLAECARISAVPAPAGCDDHSSSGSSPPGIAGEDRCAATPAEAGAVPRRPSPGAASLPTTRAGASGFILPDERGDDDDEDDDDEAEVEYRQNSAPLEGDVDGPVDWRSLELSKILGLGAAVKADDGDDADTAMPDDEDDSLAFGIRMAPWLPGGVRRGGRADPGLGVADAYGAESISLGSEDSDEGDGSPEGDEEEDDEQRHNDEMMMRARVALAMMGSSVRMRLFRIEEGSNEDASSSDGESPCGGRASRSRSCGRSEGSRDSSLERAWADVPEAGYDVSAA